MKEKIPNKITQLKDSPEERKAAKDELNESIDAAVKAGKAAHEAEIRNLRWELKNASKNVGEV